MKNSKELLTSVLHTTQMGQTGIRSVLPHAVSVNLKKELKDQLTQYDALERDCLQVARNRGWQLTDLNPAIQTMSTAMARARMVGGNRDSKIAGMLIQGNTRGMITGLKNLHQARSHDEPVEDLARKLINHESVNIQKSQPYL